MPSFISSHASKDLVINQPQKQSDSLSKKKCGQMQYRTVTIVILGSASALAAISAITAAIFISLLAAIAIAAACLVLAVSAILVSKIKATQTNPTIKETDKKTQQQFSKEKNQASIEEPNKPTLLNEEPNADAQKKIDELQHQLQKMEQKYEELKKSKNNEVTPEKPDHSKTLQELNLEKDFLQKNMQELQKQLEDKNLEIQDLKIDFKEETECIALAMKESQQNLGTDISKQLETTKNKLKQKKQKKKYESLRKNVLNILSRNSLDNEPIKKGQLMGQLLRLEKKEIKNIEDIHYDAKTEEKAAPILEEIIRTETSFHDNIQALKSHFDTLKVEKLITEVEYNTLTNGWTDIIEESSKLFKKLNASDRTAERLKAYQEAFMPKNIKKYFEAYLICVPPSRTIKAKLDELEQNPRGKKLSDDFSKKQELNHLSDYPMMFMQRVTRHKELMQPLCKAINGPKNYTKLLEHNLAYITTYVNYINEFIPRF